MRATCLRVSAASKPGPPSDPRPRITTVLDLRLIDTNEDVTIDLSHAFRRHFPTIQPRRRQYFAATMPPDVTLEPYVRKGTVMYRLAAHDLDHWADQVRAAAATPFSIDLERSTPTVTEDR